MCLNGQSGTGRLTLSAYAPTAKPPDFMSSLPLTPCAKVRSSIYHCQNAPSQLAPLVQPKRSAAATEVRKRPSRLLAGSKVSSMSAAPPRRDTDSIRRRIKEDRCRDFSLAPLTPKAGRLDPLIPHRPGGAITDSAPKVRCDPHPSNPKVKHNRSLVV